MRSMQTLGFSVGFAHVLAVFRFAVMGGAWAVIDLAAGVRPYLAGTATRRRALCGFGCGFRGRSSWCCGMGDGTEADCDQQNSKRMFHGTRSKRLDVSRPTLARTIMVTVIMHRLNGLRFTRKGCVGLACQCVFTTQAMRAARDKSEVSAMHYKSDLDCKGRFCSVRCSAIHGRGFTGSIDSPCYDPAWRVSSHCSVGIWSGPEGSSHNRFL